MWMTLKLSPPIGNHQFRRINIINEPIYILASNIYNFQYN